MDDIELKPCPFCGGKAKVGFPTPNHVKKQFWGNYVAVGCVKCGCSTPLINANNRTRSPLMNAAHEKEAMKKAAEIWNLRT